VDLRIGIIGAGQAGERHAVGFAATAGTTLVGVADLAEERARELTQRFGGKAFRDWRELLEVGLDLLVVSLPHNMHVEPAEAAAERGMHVLMEKPLATTLEDARRIIDVCEAARVKLTISFVHRFREELQLARRWLDAGLLGDPLVASERMGGQRGSHLPAWVGSKEVAGGGVLMYSAIHGVDRLRWLLSSDVRRVTAETRQFSGDTEVEEAVTALLTFESGATATLTAEAPLYRAQPAVWETELYGTSGMLRVRTRHFAERSNDREMEHVDTGPLAKDQGPHYNFARQAQAFVRAIREDRPPDVTPEDGLKSLEVALAVYRSAVSGETVELG
jgi:predicted dehydrogenase